MPQLDWIQDNRTDCYSVMVTYSLKKYLELVESAYTNKGGLEKQRTALKTSTARRIRERMVSDLKGGAIFPPIVLGVILSNEQVNQLVHFNPSEFKTLISDLSHSLTIIDGMQRTTAMYEVVQALSPTPEQKEDYLNRILVRAEHWVAKSINSLIYRMLVLNTGQVPWNLRRQLEVVFKPILDEIKKSNTALKLLEVDDAKHRKEGGQYQANNLIELFIAFGLRKEKVNLQEQLADEFSRLDFIEATSNAHFIEAFNKILNYFVKLDIAFDQYRPQDETKERFKRGKNIFDSQPARVGFIAACARYIMGKPGIERSHDEKETRLKKLSDDIESLLKRLEKMDEQTLGEFLELVTLKEVSSSKKTGKLGDYERAFFLKAFETLVEEKFDVPSMRVCWRAY